MLTDEQPVLDQLPDRAETGMARSAGLLSMGNATSRVLGLVREIVIAAFFGATGQVSAFRVASQVPVLLYDFLVGGMLSAALVPVLSDYAQRRRRGDYAELVSLVLSLFGLVLALLVLLLEAFAPQLAWLMAAGFRESDPELLVLTTQLIRIVAPAVWLFSMAGLFTAMLYSLRRFAFPAMATAVYNLGIVVAAPLLAERIGIFSLAVGILLGGVAQIVLMGSDLRRIGLSIRLRFNWRHPALQRILRLYLPIAAGLVISLMQIVLDRRLASGTGEQSIAWMSNATTLQQMPLGLISVAISLAALPRLSQFYAARQDDAYRRTLARGLRMVLLLIIPSAIGLWVLGEPLVRVLFERNRFTSDDTYHVVQALNIYVFGMVFAAIDYPLNFAFYARSNTLLPALVGVISVGSYVVVAYALIGALGYLGLVWADTAKQATHALIMSILLLRYVGPLRAHMGSGLAMIGLGGATMVVAMLVVGKVVEQVLPAGTLGDLLLLAVVGGSGVVAYAFPLVALGMPEMRDVIGAVRARLTQRR